MLRTKFVLRYDLPEMKSYVIRLVSLSVNWLQSPQDVTPGKHSGRWSGVECQLVHEEVICWQAA
jgi:hypothetical protein